MSLRHSHLFLGQAILESPMANSSLAYYCTLPLRRRREDTLNNAFVKFRLSRVAEETIELNVSSLKLSGIAAAERRAAEKHEAETVPSASESFNSPRTINPMLHTVYGSVAWWLKTLSWTQVHSSMSAQAAAGSHQNRPHRSHRTLNVCLEAMQAKTLLRQTRFQSLTYGDMEGTVNWPHRPLTLSIPSTLSGILRMLFFEFPCHMESSSQEGFCRLFTAGF